MTRYVILAATVLFEASREKQQQNTCIEFHFNSLTYIQILCEVCRDIAHNLPVNSLEVISWIPRGVKQHYHIGPYKVKTKTTCPDGKRVSNHD